MFTPLLAELQDNTVVTGLTALATLPKETCFCWHRSIPAGQQSADCATVPVNRWPPYLCYGCWDHIHGFHPVLHVYTGKQTQEEFQLPHLLNFVMYAYQFSYLTKHSRLVYTERLLNMPALINSWTQFILWEQTLSIITRRCNLFMHIYMFIHARLWTVKVHGHKRINY